MHRLFFIQRQCVHNPFFRNPDQICLLCSKFCPQKIFPNVVNREEFHHISPGIASLCGPWRTDTGWWLGHFLKGAARGPSFCLTLFHGDQQKHNSLRSDDLSMLIVVKVLSAGRKHLLAAGFQLFSYKEPWHSQCRGRCTSMSRHLKTLKWSAS